MVVSSANGRLLRETAGGAMGQIRCSRMYSLACRPDLPSQIWSLFIVLELAGIGHAPIRLTGYS